jgi:thymidylate synthase (FAD)
MTRRIDLPGLGYVRLVDHTGSDEGIVESARMSTDGEFRKWSNRPGEEGDERLLRYLASHWHTSPFEMAWISFEVKAPIFVVRQWQRHRTQSYNEVSARYVELDTDGYMPDFDDVMRRSREAAATKNRQASGNGVIADAVTVAGWLESARELTAASADLYQRAIERGIPRELARIFLPLSTFTRMRAGANLLNWIRFLRLRDDEHAQEEIQAFARAIRHMLTELYPRSMSAHFPQPEPST